MQKYCEEWEQKEAINEQLITFTYLLTKMFDKVNNSKMNEFRDDMFEIPEGEACGADLACEEHSYQEESSDEEKGNKGGADDFFPWLNKSKQIFTKRRPAMMKLDNEDILKRIAEVGNIRKLVTEGRDISSEEEEILLREQRDLKEALYFKNQNLILNIARKLYYNHFKSLPEMDIRDWVNELVLRTFKRSIDKYSAEKGAQYATFLVDQMKRTNLAKMQKDGVSTRDILFRKREFECEDEDGYLQNKGLKEDLLYYTMLKAGFPEVNGETSLEKLNGFVGDRALLENALKLKVIEREDDLPDYLKAIKPPDFSKAWLFQVYRFNRKLIHYMYPSLAPPFEHGIRALSEVSVTDLPRKRDDDREEDFLANTPDDFRNDVGAGDNEQARIDSYNELREYLERVYAASVEGLNNHDREIIEAIDRISSARRRNDRGESIGGYVQRVRKCNHDREKRLIGAARQSFARAFSQRLVARGFSEIIEFVDPLSFFRVACAFCRSKGLLSSRDNQGLSDYLLDAIVANTKMKEDIQSAAEGACTDYQRNGKYASLLRRMKQDPKKTEWNPDAWIKKTIGSSPANVKAELFDDLTTSLEKELKIFRPYPYDDYSQGPNSIHDVASRSRDDEREISYFWVMEKIDRLPCIRELLSTRFAEHGVGFEKILKSRKKGLNNNGG